MQGLALHFESGAGERLAVFRDLHHLQAAGDVNRAAYLASTRGTDGFKIPQTPAVAPDRNFRSALFFCHIDNYVHYH